MLIHQESIITAAPQAVYEVLTDGQKFAELQALRPSSAVEVRPVRDEVPGGG